MLYKRNTQEATMPIGGALKLKGVPLNKDKYVPTH